MSAVPINRIRVLNEDSSRPNADFVLYWMIAFRRPNWNFALQRAVELAQQYRKPLVILEALRCDYHWANDRIHQFVIEGMIDNERAFRDTPSCTTPIWSHRRGKATACWVHYQNVPQQSSRTTSPASFCHA